MAVLKFEERVYPFVKMSDIPEAYEIQNLNLTEGHCLGNSYEIAQKYGG